MSTLIFPSHIIKEISISLTALSPMYRGKEVLPRLVSTFRPILIEVEGWPRFGQALLTRPIHMYAILRPSLRSARRMERRNCEHDHLHPCSQSRNSMRRAEARWLRPPQTASWYALTCCFKAGLRLNEHELRCPSLGQRFAVSSTHVSLVEGGRCSLRA